MSQTASREIAVASKVMRHLHLVGATGHIRTATYDDRDHIVVPVIALLEGVIHAVNAPTPEFVPLSCIASAPQGWNGRPVVLGHPTKDGRQISANAPEVLTAQSFGLVFGARLAQRQLAMEAWVDPDRAVRVGAAPMLQDMYAGKPVEVSVGAFVVTERTTGLHNGQRYEAKWRDIVPDHLAFLPNGIGACSVAMGCGTRSIHLVTAGGIQMISKEEEELDPLDGYAPALQQRRRAEEERRGGATPVSRAAELREESDQLRAMSSFRQSFYHTAFSTRRGVLPPATSDVYLNPPDPYAAGLEALRRREQGR